MVGVLVKEGVSVGVGDEVTVCVKVAVGEDVTVGVAVAVGMDWSTAPYVALDPRKSTQMIMPDPITPAAIPREARLYRRKDLKGKGASSSKRA